MLIESTLARIWVCTCGLVETYLLLLEATRDLFIALMAPLHRIWKVYTARVHRISRWTTRPSPIYKSFSGILIRLSPIDPSLGS